MGLFLNIIISLALSVVAYLLAPKPTQPKTTTKNIADPTASAGIPVPVLFGTMTIKSPNCIWFGDRSYTKTQVDA